MADELGRLKTAVGAWYREEINRLAHAFAETNELESLDYSELIRRANIYFACEMTQLSKPGDDVRLDPGTEDFAQLQRVAQAMRSKGVAVPDSIRTALGEDSDT